MPLFNVIHKNNSATTLNNSSLPIQFHITAMNPTIPK